MEIRGHSEEMAARQLAGFADAIDVLWPAGVRVSLAGIGRALVAHHGRADAPTPASSPAASPSSPSEG